MPRHARRCRYPWRGAIGVVEFTRAVDADTLCAAFGDCSVCIRPMGKVVYLTPALTIGSDDLDRLTHAVRRGAGVGFEAVGPVQEELF
jgi:adenosylmethionine-8-amino-7-oxononanoate aminotransferase